MAALSISHFAGRAPAQTSSTDAPDAPALTESVLAQASPALIYALEAWGTVVAHRAGRLAHVTLTKRAIARNKARTGGRFAGMKARLKIYREDVEKIHPTVWELTRDWHYATRNERSYPKLVDIQLVLSKEEINRRARHNARLRERADLHNAGHAVVQGSYPGQVIDLSDTESARSMRDAPDVQTHMQTVRVISPRASIVSGFLLMCELFRGDESHWATSRRIQSLLTWLFVIPRYHGHLDRQDSAVNDIREWLKGQRGGKCDEETVRAVHGELKRWISRANSMLRSRMENTLVRDLLAIAHFRARERPEAAATIAAATGLAPWRVVSLIRKYRSELSDMARMPLGVRVVWACDQFAESPGRGKTKPQIAPTAGEIATLVKVGNRMYQAMIVPPKEEENLDEVGD